MLINLNKTLRLIPSITFMFLISISTHGYGMIESIRCLDQSGKGVFTYHNHQMHYPNLNNTTVQSTYSTLLRDSTGPKYANLSVLQVKGYNTSSEIFSSVEIHPDNKSLLVTEFYQGSFHKGARYLCQDLQIKYTSSNPFVFCALENDDEDAHSDIGFILVASYNDWKQTQGLTSLYDSPEYGSLQNLTKALNLYENSENI